MRSSFSRKPLDEKEFGLGRCSGDAPEEDREMSEEQDEEDQSMDEEEGEEGGGAELR